MSQRVALGFHGAVIRASNVSMAAVLWSRATGLPVRKRSRGEIVLGFGPEIFVVIRKVRRGEAPGVAELHLAVSGSSRLRRRGKSDALGGDSMRGLASGVVLEVREFRRAPGPAWRRKRRGGD